LQIVLEKDDARSSAIAPTHHPRRCGVVRRKGKWAQGRQSFSASPTMIRHGIILFQSITTAIQAEQILRGAGLQIKWIPTPAGFSGDCGMALRFDWHKHNQIRALLELARLNVLSINPLN
jgi:hypothetical protein